MDSSRVEKKTMQKIALADKDAVDEPFQRTPPVEERAELDRLLICNILKTVNEIDSAPVHTDYRPGSRSASATNRPRSMADAASEARRTRRHTASMGTTGEGKVMQPTPIERGRYSEYTSSSRERVVQANFGDMVYMR